MVDQALPWQIRCPVFPQVFVARRYQTTAHAVLNQAAHFVPKAVANKLGTPAEPLCRTRMTPIIPDHHVAHRFHDDPH